MKNSEEVGEESRKLIEKCFICDIEQIILIDFNYIE